MKSSRWYLIAIMLLAAFMAFFKLGAASIHEWDEARRLINAIGMIENQDFFNYYYLQIPDHWHAKPFLNTWIICMDFQLFGVSEFTLRLHSALAAVVIILVTYKLVRLYQTPRVALLTVLTLLASRAVMGFHLGRTGDQDALLIMFLLPGLFFALKEIDFRMRNGLLLTGLFWGLAFLTKSFVSLLFVPGLFLYVLYRGKLKILLRKYTVYSSILIYAAFVTGYYLLVQQFGHSAENAPYGGSNVWETNIKYDFIRRFFQPGLESAYDPLFFFKTMDIYYSIWNYILYLGAIAAAFLFWKNVRRTRVCFSIQKPDLAYVSLFISIPIILVFSIAQNQKAWYFAPAFPFLAILLSLLIFKLQVRINWLKYVLLAAFLTAFYLQINWIAKPRTETKAFFYDNQEIIENAPLVMTNSQVRQDHVAYILMFNRNTLLDDIEKHPSNFLEGQLVYIQSDLARKYGMKVLAEHGGYSLARFSGGE